MSISHKREEVIKRGRNRKKRPKTFKTEQSAKAWAEKQGLKNYALENLKTPLSSKKKIRVKILK
jgi:hypothetical protein